MTGDQRTATPAGPVDLIDAARTELLSSDRTRHLADELPDPHDDTPLRVAITGPHNAGKSLLMAGLLNLPLAETEELVAAEPKTREVTEYRGPGYTLLDLPGTLSGNREHDTEARRGVRRADALLIVTTTELPGEAETAQIRCWLGEDGFAGRALVVVNKANAENSDLGIIRSEIGVRLGDEFASTPVLFTDALDYKHARFAAGLNDEDRSMLIADSGIDELATRIQHLVDNGATLRGPSQLMEVRRVIDAAVEQWATTAEDDAQDATANRIHAALDHAESEFGDRLSRVLAQYRDSARAVANDLAAAVSEKDGSIPDAAITRADTRLGQCEKGAVSQANQALESVVGRLSNEFDDAHAQYNAWTRSAPRRQPAPDTAPLRPRLADKVLDDVRKKTTEGLKRMIDGLAEGSSAGTRAHDLAKRINQARGVDLKPHVHKNLATKINKGAGLVSTIMDVAGPAFDGIDIVDSYLTRERVRSRRQSILDDVDRAMMEEIATLQTSFQQHAETYLGPYRAAAAPIVQAASERASNRDAALARLGELRERATGTT